ncbi:hypothetical protein PbJCM13498_26610 [Prolixibacter bellariivorans]|uniref:Uncharacterized protein n=1 Tax=Prolixibacter bellariivorans TaxID=314319 RepID=A0A5M4B1I0_9BACT|nr:hypothetical protein PbJCM13498_26610 [Prolixibacter bellariivorans]
MKIINGNKRLRSQLVNGKLTRDADKSQKKTYYLLLTVLSQKDFVKIGHH